MHTKTLSANGIQEVQVNHTLTEETTKGMAGKLLDENSYDILIREDADVYKPNGDLLIRYRNNVIPKALYMTAWKNLRDAAKVSKNRGIAAGLLESIEDTAIHNQLAHPATWRGTRFHLQKDDGTISKTTYAKPVQSGLVGFYDRSPRTNICRTTAYGLDHPERFTASIPYIRYVDTLFRKLLPERHAAQMSKVDTTHPSWVIHGTSFTTLTVNKNWQTAVHTDKGDLDEGFGVLTVFRTGKPYDGCFLCFPKYRVAVDIQNGGIILTDVHEWHGNTPFRGIAGTYERLSIVFYYRKKMKSCLSPDEELERAKGKAYGAI